MVTTTLQGPLAALRESEIDLINDIAASLADADEADADRRHLQDAARDLGEMFFLVVIIGEFNAGKSSFVNALIGDEVLPMGITPTTEVIELIRQSDVKQTKPINETDSLREWAHPNTGGDGVAIVDTPGTGSVFKRHETTAKDFLHRSDLVIFLISAKRAFAETERIYLETAKDYGKKIILVVNQVDLLEPSERSQVKRFVEQQVKELLGIQPLIFMVSAKESLNAMKSGNRTDGPGGVDAVRGHLRGVFASAPPAKQKLLTQLDTVDRIVNKYHGGIQSKADRVRGDTARVRELQQELQQQSLGLNAQLTEARSEIDKVFVGLRTRGESFIDNNLSIRKLGGAGSREKLQQEFQDVVIGRAVRDLNEATNGYINAVIDQSRSYWRGVIDRLNELRDILEQEVSGLDSNIYSEQRDSLEEAIRIAESELKNYSSGRLLEEMHKEFEVNMGNFRGWAAAAIGGFITAVVAAAAPGTILGTSAALVSAAFVLAAPLTIAGGALAIRYYRRITNDLKQDFFQRVDRLMKTYHTALDDLTRKERQRLTQYGNQVLTPIFSRLDVLEKRYSDQQVKFDGYRHRLSTLRQGIEQA